MLTGRGAECQLRVLIGILVPFTKDEMSASLSVTATRSSSGRSTR